MASIFDLLGGMSPEQNQGLLAAAAQVLRNSGPGRPYSFGQGLGDAIGAYQGNMEYQKQRKVKDQFQALELEDAQMGLDEKKRVRDLQRQIEAAAQGAYRTAGQQAASLPGGPTVANAERIGEFKEGMDVDTFINNVSRFAPLQALEYRKMFAKAGPKFDSGFTWVIGPDGKPMAVRTADDGSVKRIDGLAPRDKMELANMGGKDVAYNPFELQPGQEFKRTMTPGEIAANSLGWANHGLSKQRLEIERAEAAARAALGKAPTEFQGKSAAFGLRATEADKIITELTGQFSPAAINSKTSVENWPLIGGALGAATNSFALSPTDQKAEQAQRDFVNAVLRQESGAAIGPDEFNNARKQYFPQPGDGPDVIAQKARNRQLAIQGFQSNAGRAAMAAPPRATTSGGWSIQRVD